jgi:hypothetical protein
MMQSVKEVGHSQQLRSSSVDPNLLDSFLILFKGGCDCPVRIKVVGVAHVLPNVSYVPHCLHTDLLAKMNWYFLPTKLQVVNKIAPKGTLPI